MMPANNTAQSHSLAPIETQLTLLENNLLKFKLTLSQLSSREVPSQMLNIQLTQQINSITYYVNTMMGRFEGEIKMIKGKMGGQLEQLRQEKELEKWNQAKIIKDITNKVGRLEEQINQMRNNEDTLINSISTLMQRYQIQEQPTILRDHHYLSSRVVQSVANPHYNPNSSFQQSHIAQLEELSSSSYTRNNPPPPAPGPSPSGQLTTLSQTSQSSQPNQFMRTFAQGKTSLKFSNRSDGTTATGPRLAPAPRTTATVSLDKNQHRFRFMMAGLQRQ